MEEAVKWALGMLDAKMGTDYEVEISNTGGEYIIYHDTAAGQALKAEHERLAAKAENDDCSY